MLPILLAGLLVAACAPGDDGGGNGSDGPVVTVTLREHEIELSGDAMAGEIVFELSNDGEQVHGFAVEGNEIDETLTSDIRPGSTERVTIELEPGTYTVWCPIGDHRDRGMEATLEVTEASGS